MVIRLFFRHYLVLFSAALVINSGYSQEIKILTLGNSITWGTNVTPDPNEAVNVSYRHRLFQLLNQAGYEFDFIGSRSSGYNVFSDAQHCGIPGARGQHIFSILKTGYNSQPMFNAYETQGPYLDFFPADIILLELGTNDVAANDVNDLSEYDSIFNEIDKYEDRSGKPVVVFVSKIINVKNESGECNTSTRVNTFNANLEALVNSRINEGDKLVLFDLQCSAGIDYNADMLDIYHPNEQGYDKMAQAFYNALNGYNNSPVITQIPEQVISEGINSFPLINLDDYVEDVEDTDDRIIWRFFPALPENLNITLINRLVNVTVKDNNWNGSDTITFLATDRGKVIEGLKKSDTIELVFTVTPVNDTPSIILPQNRSVDEGKIYSQVIYVEDADIEDNPVLAPLTLPQWLTFNPTDNKIEGIPQRADIGDNTIVFRASDGKVFVDSSFIIKVKGNSFPVFTSVPDTIIKTGEVYSYKIVVNDADENDIITLLLGSEIPDWLHFDPFLMTISGRPMAANAGKYSINIKATDGKDTVTQLYSLNVTTQSSLDQSGTFGLKVFPSPAKNKINIRVEDYSGSALISFFDIEGRLFNELRSDFDEGLCVLDLSSFPRGIYVIKIVTNEKVLFGKLLKD